MSATAPREPLAITPPIVVLLRDKSLAELTYHVDGPEPFTLLGHTIAEAGRPIEPLLWRADGHYASPTQVTHYLDIVGIHLVGEDTADGRKVFGPFTGLKRPGKKKGQP